MSLKKSMLLLISSLVIFNTGCATNNRPTLVSQSPTTESILNQNIATLQANIKLNPNDADSNYNLANIYYDQIKLNEAVNLYKEAIRIKPTYTYAYYKLA